MNGGYEPISNHHLAEFDSRLGAITDFYQGAVKESIRNCILRGAKISFQPRALDHGRSPSRRIVDRFGTYVRKLVLRQGQVPSALEVQKPPKVIVIYLPESSCGQNSASERTIPKERSSSDV